MKQQNRAYIYALAAILFWSTMSSAFKITLRFIDFRLMLLFACASSVTILFLILIIQGKLKQLKKTTIKQIGSSAILGFLNPFAYYLILFKAYDLLAAQIAGTLNYFWPVVLVLLSIPLLKQKISYKSILALLISFFGIIIISTEGKILNLEFNNLFGVLLAVGSALFWALYWIFNMKDKRDEVAKLFLNFCFGLFYILIAIFIWDGFQFPKLEGIIGSVYIGFFEMGITYVLWLKALSLSANTAKVSNLVYLSPFIALLVIHLTVGEDILLSTFIGLFFIISGIIIQKYIDPPETTNKK